MSKSVKRAIYSLLFLISTIILFYKCFFAMRMSFADESVYIALPFRLAKGDVMFVDEWNLGQTSSLLLVPLCYLWNRIMGNSMEGVVLFFRCAYVIFKLITSLYAYKLIKKTAYKEYAEASVLLYWSFTPQNIETLSYNSISIGLVYLCGLYILVDSKKTIDYMICGLLFSLAVYVQPFNVITYFVYFAGVILAVVVNKYRSINDKSHIELFNSSYFGIKSFSLFSLSAFALFVLLAIYLLTSVPFENLIDGIKYTLDDSDHYEKISILSQCKHRTIHNIDSFFFVYPVVTAINAFWLIILIVARLKKKYLTVGTTIVLIVSTIIIALTERSWPQNIVFMMVIWSTAYAIILSEKLDYRLLLVNILGLAYSFSITLATNTGQISAFGALIVMGCFSVLLWKNVHNDNVILKSNDSNKILFLGLAVFTIFTTCMLHLFRDWDRTMVFSEYSNRVERGPFKGIYLTDEPFELYNEMLDDLDSVNCSSEDTLLYGESLPLAYLYKNPKVGIMSMYFFNFDYDRLANYYEFNPEKWPNVIYFPEVKPEDYESKLFNKLLEGCYVIEKGEKIIARRRS